LQVPKKFCHWDFDIETGGPIFQVHFTNATCMMEKTFITEAAGDFAKGQNIYFGFNVSRVFTVSQKRKKP
jgi:Membrane bound beta barrel domain (DUF5777)